METAPPTGASKTKPFEEADGTTVEKVAKALSSLHVEIRNILTLSVEVELPIRPEHDIVGVCISRAMEGLQERSRALVDPPHFAVVKPAGIEMAIWPKGESTKSAGEVIGLRTGKYVHERTAVAVIAQDALRQTAVWVKHTGIDVSIRAKSEGYEPSQSKIRDKGSQRSSSCAVVTPDPTYEPIADIEVPIRTESELIRTRQPPTARGHKVPQECSGDFVVAFHTAGRMAAHVEFAVRSDLEIHGAD